VGYNRRVEDLWTPDWLRRVLGDHFFLTVDQAQLHHGLNGRQYRAMTSEDCDAVVAAMRQLPRLHYLYFAHTGVTDDDVLRFAPLADQVDEIFFNETHFSKLTGACLEHLATWPKLAALSFVDEIDPQYLPQLATFPALKRFQLSNHRLDGEAFAAIVRCRKLEHVSLYRCTFSGAEFGRLREAPSLLRVLLHNTQPKLKDPSSIPSIHQAGPTQQRSEDQFNFVPEYDFEWLSPNSQGGSKFPDDRYKEWLEEILPGVEVISFSTS